MNENNMDVNSVHAVMNESRDRQTHTVRWLSGFIIWLHQEYNSLGKLMWLVEDVRSRIRVLYV